MNSIILAVAATAVGYGVIWFSVNSADLTAGIIGGVLLGGGVVAGLLGR